MAQRALSTVLQMQNPPARAKESAIPHDRPAREALVRRLNSYIGGESLRRHYARATELGFGELAHRRGCGVSGG